MKQNMPKLIFALLICLLVCFSVHAQYPKLIVQFTDKNNSPFKLDKSAKYLSLKARKRRNRYAIAIDSSDLPVNPSYIKQVLAQGAVTYLSQSKWLNQILINSTDNNAINAIRNLPFVKTAQPIGQLQQNISNPLPDKFRSETITPFTKKAEVNAVTTTFNYGNSYNQVHIHNGEFLHDKGFTGKGIIIAIIDAGFYHYKTSKAFDSVQQAGRILGERDFVDFDNSVNEDDTHGEYCLSTIAANVPGVMVGTAPHASFWLLRGENTASEYPIEEHNWVAAAEFADSAGADMISSSLGYFQFDDASFNHTYANFYNNSTMISKGATYAAKKGMIVTNSAGNEGSTSWKYIIFPADADSVCAVGAINTSGGIASFSSYGYPGKVKPNIVSVGSNTVVYTATAVSTASGTSFSNPNINGLIACLWQAFPKFNNMTILDAVYRNSDRYSNPTDRFGYGIPDMKKAFLYLRKLKNQQSFGNEWLFATHDPAANKINIRLIGQVDGEVTLKLLNEKGIVLAADKLTTETEEVFGRQFAIADDAKSSRYFIQYSDASASKSIELKNEIFTKSDWLRAAPVPVQHSLTARLKAPESGKIILRLMDVNGNILESRSMNVVKNNSYTFEFNKVAFLSEGNYYLEYRGLQENKTISILK